MTRNAGSGVADLVRRARDPRGPIREQHAAFALLVERFEQMAFTCALQGCDDTESARDACQDAFVTAWRMLPSLREPAAFGGWLKRLVRTRCARVRRRRTATASVLQVIARACEPACDAADVVGRREMASLVRSAVMRLPRAQREAVILFYFLGEPLHVAARVLGITVGHAGKHVYEARLRLRRELPRSLTQPLLARAPVFSFARLVRAGVLDDLAGEYRFDQRPGRTVLVRREGDILAGYAGGQRHVLTSKDAGTLVPVEYDGEARFRRDRRGRVSHFVYYEFGRRLGTARRIS